jgi:putative toxin-antitoxin system antitoxin component (TIGR02293 family)
MSSAILQIGEWLGTPRTSSETDVLRVVENRLATSTIKRLGALGLTRAEIDANVIPSRTLQHRRSRREKLTLEESDRVLRMLRVLSSAEAVYSTRERALAWLRAPNTRLNGRAPFSLLNTEAGSRIVLEMLVQIDEGMFV